MSVRFVNKMVEVGGVAKFRFGGEVQHYRMPAEVWQDRLEKVAALGLDTVGCYFGWNFHSPAPGVYEFGKPDYDIGRFCRVLKAAGLFLEARPGPFLCNELDLGGFPFWLLGVDENWRTGNDRHLRHCGEWFRAVNKVLAPEQYPAGPITMYQVENEHFQGDKKLYEFLRDEARRNGITVPFISNGGGSVYRCGATGITDCMDMYTGIYEYFRWRSWFDILYRMLPPDDPMMVLEYRAGNHPPWGQPLYDEIGYPTEWMLTQTRMMIGMGANFVNPFVICGGISPVGLNADHTCTNYGEDTAVNHWGGLNPRFYGYRLLVLSGNSVAEELGEARPVPVGFGSDNAHVECFVRKGARGTFLFPVNLSSDVETATLCVGDGRHFGPVRLRGRTSQFLFADIELASGTMLHFCSFEVLKLTRNEEGARMVVHAPEGWSGFAEIGGERLNFTAKASPQRFCRTINGTRIDLYVVDTPTAERTWFAPDGTPMFSNCDLLRPDGVRAELPAHLPLRLTIPAEKSVCVDGKSMEFSPAGEGLVSGKMDFADYPGMRIDFGTSAIRVGGDAWTVADISAWTPVSPWAHDAIQEPGEYAFRADFHLSGDLPETLTFPAVTSSETVFFLNGVRLGVFPAKRGPGFPGLPGFESVFDVRGILRKGKNELALSCNVYGRHNHGRPVYAGMRVPPALGERREQAITEWEETWGDTTVYDFDILVQGIPVPAGATTKRQLDFTRPAFWPEPNLDCDWMRARHYSATVELDAALRGKVLYLNCGRCNWTGVYVNGEYVGVCGADNGAWIDVSCFNECETLDIHLVVLWYWEAYPWRLTEAPRLVAFDRSLGEGWKSARVAEVQDWRDGLPGSARQVIYTRKVRVTLPDAARFDAPFCVEMDESWKRHATILWNNRPVAMYADVGPDRNFYLPREWVLPENDLEIHLDGYAGAALPGNVEFGCFAMTRRLKLLVK